MRYRLWLSVYVAVTSDARAQRKISRRAAHTESVGKPLGGAFFLNRLEMLLYLTLAYAVCVAASAASAAPALPGPVSSYEPYPKLNSNSAWQLEIRTTANQKKPTEFAAYPCIAGNCTSAGVVAEGGVETVSISAATTTAGDAADLTGCIAVVQRSSSNLITDVHQAQAAGAAAVLIINDDAALPLELSELHIPAYADAATDTAHEGTAPCLLVPREAAAALTGSAVQVRLVQGGASTPFTESVSRSAPVCYVIHNTLQHDQAELIKRKAMPRLRPSYVGTSGQAMRPRYYGKYLFIM
jgi:PA domain